VNFGMTYSAQRLDIHPMFDRIAKMMMEMVRCFATHTTSIIRYMLDIASFDSVANRLRSFYFVWIFFIVNSCVLSTKKATSFCFHELVFFLIVICSAVRLLPTKFFFRLIFIGTNIFRHIRFFVRSNTRLALVIKTVFRRFHFVKISNRFNLIAFRALLCRFFNHYCSFVKSRLSLFANSVLANDVFNYTEKRWVCQ